MKLNWFSPLPPAQTGIADYTAKVSVALQEHFETTFWTEQGTWDTSLGRNAEIRQYDPGNVPWGDLNRAHATIFNIGNDHRYHAAIWSISQRQSGIVILHDFCLQALFESLYCRQRQEPEEYLRKMQYYYGPPGRRAGENLASGILSMEYMSQHYPLTSLALENALGVIVHSKVTLKKLQADLALPAFYTPLPCAPDDPLPHTRSRGTPYRLIAFGYFATNRGLDLIFEAIAGFGEREEFLFDIFGDFWDKEYVSARIRSLSLHRRITLHGVVSEAVLDKALSQAHLAFNLRSPDMGEASSSQLRMWQHGIPSMVSRTGWYAELPQEAVLFVRPGQEIGDIRAYLESFLHDPSCFDRIGERGRQIVSEHHQPGAYAEAVVEIVKKVRDLPAYPVTQHLVARAGAEMSMYVESDMPDNSLRTVAGAIRALTGD